MIISQSLATTTLNAGLARYNGGSLTLYSGQMPPTPEWPPAAGNIALVEFTFANPAFPSGSNFMNTAMTAVASFVASSVTPTENGPACFGRALDSSGTVLELRTVAMPWAPGLAVTQFQFIMANANVYVCTTGGTTSSSGLGPSGTGSVIADASAVWCWYSAGAPDIQLSNAALSTSQPASIAQYWLSFPCL